MSKKIIAIVPAAGIGERAQTALFAPPSFDAAGAPHARQESVVLPKQYRLLRGEPMLRWAVKALLADERVEQVRVAIAPYDIWAEQALSGLPRTVWRPCGGATRAATVAAALQDAQLDSGDWVLVHDAARPGLPADALKRLIDTCLGQGVGGLLALAVPDTVKRGVRVRLEADGISQQQADNAGNNGNTSNGGIARQDDIYEVQSTVARDALWLAQTPQMFPAGRLLQALQAAGVSNASITDEASALELTGYMPRLVAGSARNFKVTWPDDFELMEKWL